MKIELKQQFQIESARFLPNLPAEHPCRQMHGHSFKITLTLAGEMNQELGWLIDYNDIVKAMQPLIQQLDHKTLNEIPGLENPTTENLCVWLYERSRGVLPLVTRVTISETASTECSFP